jgi:CDP-diacylglycerol--glycerol-3-phosphate 3-phosphatidyltransferase
LTLRKAIPWSLVVFRFLVGPALIFAARQAHIAGFWLGAMVAAGFISDIYDGVLARRWNTASSALRIADSTVDIVFYLGVLSALVLRHWPAIRERLWLIAVVLALEIGHSIFALIKFRRTPSYHSYIAKSWGFLLAFSTITLLSFNQGQWLLTLALVWGFACELEGFAMSAILPEWTHDVKTLSRAFALRREMLASPASTFSSSANSAGPAPELP